jgi:phosphinothricin acetyltransferase
MIRKATPEDAAPIAAIYNYYLENTTITFETDAVSTVEMRRRIAEISAGYPFTVYESDGRVTGYCHANMWKKKHAYRSTVESTVYVDSAFLGRGIGSELMTALIEELRRLSFHAVIACITTPNPTSVGMHEKLGFRQVSSFSEVGFKFGRLLDVGDWELILQP